MADRRRSVIDPMYCASDYFRLHFSTERGATFDGNNIAIFRTEDISSNGHNRRLLCDDRRNPIVTLWIRIMTCHGRCEVFRGKSTDSSRLLFSVKRSEVCGSTFEVFLTQNNNGSVCDFRVDVSEGRSSCTIYVGDSPEVVAKMENDDGFFNVDVHPGVDHAFIVVLLMIINEKIDYRKLKNDTKRTGRKFVAGVGACVNVAGGLNGLILD